MSKILLWGLLAWLLSSGQGASAQMLFLEAGAKAPDIKTEDVRGNKVHLRTLAKGKKVLLVFLRYAWCPICNLRTHELIGQYEALQARGYEVVVFYQTPKEKLLPYAEDKHIPFTVIPDYEGKHYALYGLEYSESKFRASFKNEKTQAAIEEAIKLSDQDSEQQKYGVEKESADFLIPGDFVVDKKGRLERVYYGTFFGDHLPLGELK